MEYLLNGVIKDSNRINGFLVGRVDNETIKTTGAPLHVEYVTINELKQLCKNNKVEYIWYNDKLDKFEVKFTKEDITKFKCEYKYSNITIKNLSSWSGYVNELPHFKLSNFIYAENSEFACGSILNVFKLRLIKTNIFLCKLVIYGSSLAIRNLEQRLLHITNRNYDEFIKFGDNIISGYLPLDICSIFCKDNKLILDVSRINKCGLSTIDTNIVFKLCNVDTLSEIREIKKVSDMNIKNYLNTV